MIYTIICDTSRVALCHAEKLTGVYKLKSIIGTPKNEEQQRVRTASYIGLCSLYETLAYKLLGKRVSAPAVGRNLLGKPYFIKEKNDSVTVFPAFNLSHSKNLAAIVFSDEEEQLGVDIEVEGQVKQAEKIRERLTANVMGNLHLLDKNSTRYMFATQREDGMVEEIKNLPPDFFSYFGRESRWEKKGVAIPCPSVFYEWTLTEAMLKADGGGFCRLSDLGEIAHMAECESVKFGYLGKDVYLSVARIK